LRFNYCLSAIAELITAALKKKQPTIVFGGNLLECKSQVKNIDVIFDSTLSFEHHQINSVIRKRYYHLRILRAFETALIQKPCIMIVQCLITSQLDY